MSFGKKLNEDDSDKDKLRPTYTHNIDGQATGTDNNVIPEQPTYRNWKW